MHPPVKVSLQKYVRKGKTSLTELMTTFHFIVM